MRGKPHPNLYNAAPMAARELIGWELISTAEGQETGGYIIETEAYAENDPASHSYKGKTDRNEPMFGPAGTIYIYFTYGMHYCFNLVVGPAGRGDAVLIRALKPTRGVGVMTQRRGRFNNLADGPAKLVQALAITSDLNGKSILSGQELPLKFGRYRPPKQVHALTRIGISRAKHKRWRFTGEF